MSPRAHNWLWGAAAAAATLVMAGPALAQQRPAATASQCFGTGGAAEVIAGCNLVLGSPRGYSADQIGQALQKRAEALSSQQRYEDAIRDLQVMIRRNYNPHVANALIADNRFAQGRYKDAETSYRQALEINSSYAAARTGLGQTLLRLERTIEAVAEFRQAIAGATNDVAAHLGLGTALQATGDLAGSIKEFDAVLRLQPNNLSALFQRAQAYQDRGEVAPALRDADAAVATATGAQRVLALAYRGRFRNNAKRYDEAIADCTAAAKLGEELGRTDPAMRAAPYICLGLARTSRGDLAAAKAEYDRALQWDRSDVALFSGRGYISYQRGRFDEAIEDFEAALRLQPKSQDALRFLGLALADKGDLAKALEVFARAREANARDPWPLMLRALALARSGERDRALTDIADAFKITGAGNSDVLLARGSVYYLLDDLASAQQDLEAALAANPDNGQASLALGRLLLRLGRTDDAAHRIDVAQRLIPNDSSLPLNKGLLALARRDPATAVSEISRSLAINSAFAEGFAARGQAYEAQGRTDLAVLDYRTARRRLALDPDGRRALALARQRLAVLEAPSLATRQPAAESGAGRLPPPRRAGQGNDDPARYDTVFCRVFEGIFSHSRRYTGVEFEAGCRPLPPPAASAVPYRP